MAVSEVLSQAIRSRAHGRCQYCLMHESLQGATFQVEHVIPRSKGGESALENLALACPGCNLHKADRTTAADPLTGKQAPLFHPVRQRWSEHFRFKGYEMEGYTAVGRATVAMLDLNQIGSLSIDEVALGLVEYVSTLKVWEGEGD